MRLIVTSIVIYFFAFSTTVIAQNSLIEILADSLYNSEVNDESSVATGAPLLITAGVFGGQSFIADTTGFLTRIEITAKKIGPQQKSSLSLEIRTGNDPAMGSSLITELFNVTSDVDAVYSIVFTTPIPVTKGDALVMIVKKISMANAEWQRSSTDVYTGGTAFINASGWITLSGQDHDFTSYVEVPDSTIVSYFSVADDGLIKVKNRITNVTDPVSAQDAATKAYVDEIKASFNEDLLDAGLNGIVEDIDGNKYKTIKVGAQVWMAENLKTTKYNDGTLIPEVTVGTAWQSLTTPAYCWYENNIPSIYAEFYGALYNYYTVADTNSLNVCPTGWDMPTDAEWTVFTDFLEDNGYGYGGSGSDIGKSVAETFSWQSSSNVGTVGNNTGSNNSSGFAGLPGGYRDFNGTFNDIGNYGLWWSSTENNSTLAWYRFLNYDNGSVDRNLNYKSGGLSVRCLRD